MPINLGWRLAADKRVKLAGCTLADSFIVGKQSSAHPPVDTSGCCLLRDSQFPKLGARQRSNLQHSTGHKALLPGRNGMVEVMTCLN